MNKRANIFTVILVFLISVFLLSQASFAAPPDYKTMPLHQAIAELKSKSDKNSRIKILQDIIDRNPETQQDRDALNEAIDSWHTDVQMYAIEMVKKTKDPRSIKKLVDKVKAIKTHSFLPILPITNVAEFILLGERAAMPAYTAKILADLKNEEALPIIVEKVGEVTQRGIMIDEGLRNILIDGYGAMALPHIAKKLNEFGDKKTVGRQHFLYIIMNTKDKAGADELRKFTANNALDVRSAAYRALGAMGEKYDLTRIFADINSIRAQKKEVAKKDRAMNKYQGPGSYSGPSDYGLLMQVEDNLFTALGQPGNVDALPILAQMVDAARKDKYKKQAFIHDVYHELSAISEIGGPEAFAYLKRVYEEMPRTDTFGGKEYKELRYKSELLSFFGRKGFVEAVPFLESIMNDKNEERVLRAGAAMKLGNIYAPSSPISDEQKYLDYYKISSEIEEGKR